MILKILIAGDGGQGVQTMADVISRAAFAKDYFVSYVPNYGLEQRGGASLAFIQIGDHDINYPKFASPDFLLVMSVAARERVSGYERKSVKLIDIKDYTEKLEQQKVEKTSYNVFFLGILTKILMENNFDLSKEIFAALEKKLSKKPNWEENKRIFNLGNV